jgi:hypothetical protein
VEEREREWEGEETKRQIDMHRKRRARAILEYSRMHNQDDNYDITIHEHTSEAGADISIPYTPDCGPVIR